jgi:Obg family GTPase CgtA-like protein
MSKCFKVVERTNWDYGESLMRFQRILEAEGISKALKKKGAVEGDLVMIGNNSNENATIISRVQMLR